MKKPIFSSIFLLLFLASACKGPTGGSDESSSNLSDSVDEARAAVENFNYIIGTQTVDPSYQFTNEPPLIETAKAMLAMGTRVIKTRDKDPQQLKALMDMPFRYYVLWVRSMYRDEPFPAIWQDGLSDEESAEEYQALYDFTKRLLTDYNQTGKVFYLGHWEGDWQLLNGFDAKVVPSNEAIQGMIDWINIRQKAIDDAKHDIEHNNVEVYQYAEVNRVRDAMDLGLKRVVNVILEKTNVDFVSYSAYDSQKMSQEEVNKTMNYIESKLLPKPGIVGKRVFVGEFGWPAKFTGYNPVEHEKKNREYMLKYLRWGTPFILYWEMYNNEILDGKQVGYWLIDDKNQKQPLYYTFEQYYQKADAFVADHYSKHGEAPADSQFLQFAIKFLSERN
jgi:hypothetical protein